MPDYDAIVIGAGHNGLTAANVLADGGAKVLVLERGQFVGGMAATRELFSGFKHSVGAWAVLVWPEAMTSRMQLEEWGFGFTDQWSSACTFGDPADTPFIMYNDPGRMTQHVLEDHAEHVVGMGGLYEDLAKFAPFFSTTMFDQTADITDAIAAFDDPQERRRLAQMWYGSAMDTVRRHFAPGEANTLQGSMCAMAIDGFDGGPWSPGSGSSLVYHYALLNPGEAGGRLLMPKGGIGMLSKALQARAEAKGAEVRLNSTVKSLTIDDGAVTAVVLRDGSEISARVVLSSLDPHTTFMGLAGGAENLPGDYVRKLGEINFNLGYVQTHFTFEGTPDWAEWLKPFARDNDYDCPSMAYIPSAEYVGDAWDEYRHGRMPTRPPAYLYLPSLVDSTLAPEGMNSATIYAPYFPYGLSPDDHREMKEVYADRCIDIFESVAPGFRERIGERVVLSDRYFASAFSAHHGDFAHGTLMPAQLLGNRMIPGEDKFGTPLAGLYMCGQGTHPGPGVTGLPGANGGAVALEALQAQKFTTTVV